jgi:ABC-type multidrug transport system ATPase subunit
MTDRSRLELDGIAVSVGGKRLLEGLSLGVEGGQRVALLGPSGSGKTTLLRVVAGLIDATEGSVRLDGQLPEAIGWTRYRRRVVYVSQLPVLLEGTALDNLRRPFGYRSAGRPFPKAAATDLLQQMGMAEAHLSQRASTLSVGQQQRVCLARALLLEPEFLLLDEPTSALDEATVEQVEESILRAARDHGTGALIATHNKSQAERLCHRQVDLDEYRI